MNILVTGANGQLGREMRIISRNSDHRFVFTDVVEAEGLETALLDMTDPDAVANMVREHDIRCIVNCAAYTNVDKAESDVALLAGIPTTRLAARIRKAPQPEYMVQPNWRASSLSKTPEASMSLSARRGSIPSLAAIS